MNMRVSESDVQKLVDNINGNSAKKSIKFGHRYNYYALDLARKKERSGCVERTLITGTKKELYLYLQNLSSADSL